MSTSTPAGHPHPKLFFAEQLVLLNNILHNRLYPPPLSNAQAWRSFNAATMCLEGLLSRACSGPNGEPSATLAMLTVTTWCKYLKPSQRASKKFRRIMSDHVAPRCREYVWFFHRGSNGYVHWHVIATFKQDIVGPECPPAGARAFARKMKLSGLNPNCDLEVPLTVFGEEIQKELSAVCMRDLISSRHSDEDLYGIVVVVMGWFLLGFLVPAIIGLLLKSSCNEPSATGFCARR